MARRLFDLVASTIGLLLAWPVLLAAAVAIKVSSPGPVFYKAERVGRNGRLFRMYKFRTMVENAAAVGPAITRSGDPRVFGVGRVLRRLKIDEIPQLMNVLRGEMAIVGPRPEALRYVQRYTPSQRQILAVLPGMTSPASLLYRHEEAQLKGDDWEKTYLDVIMPEKVAIDLAYLDRRSLLSDIGIIARTIAEAFAGPPGHQ